MVKPNKGTAGFGQMDSTAQETQRSDAKMNRESRADAANRFENLTADDDMMEKGNVGNDEATKY